MSDVTVSVTFRHMGSTAALKEYAENKVRRIGKYFTRPLEAHVILAVDAKQQKVVEVELLTHGNKIHGKEENGDLYAAINLVIDKIERQIKKHKDKNKPDRRRTHP
jgi:putative sigma-54 modulation protein